MADVKRKTRRESALEIAVRVIAMDWPDTSVHGALRTHGFYDLANAIARIQTEYARHAAKKGRR